MTAPPQTPFRKRKTPAEAEADRMARNEVKRRRAAEARAAKEAEEKRTYKKTDFSVTITVPGHDVPQEMVDALKEFVNAGDPPVTRCYVGLEQGGEKERLHMLKRDHTLAAR